MEREELKKTVKEILEEIFNQIEVAVGIEIFDIDSERENQIKLKVDIESEDANLLIGYHGDTLNSIQHIINTILYKKYGEGAAVLIDISGYREDRRKKLLEVAENASSKAKMLGKSVALYPMNSYERKVIHEKVSETEGVTSASEGDGDNRRVIITPE